MADILPAGFDQLVKAAAQCPVGGDVDKMPLFQQLPHDRDDLFLRQRFSRAADADEARSPHPLRAQGTGDVLRGIGHVRQRHLPSVFLNDIAVGAFQIAHRHRDEALKEPLDLSHSSPP